MTKTKTKNQQEQIATVTLEVPIYTGSLPGKPPYHRPEADAVSIRLLSNQHKDGLMRVFKAIQIQPTRDETVVHSDTGLPPLMNTRSEAARWLFSLVDAAYKEQVLGQEPVATVEDE